MGNILCLPSTSRLVCFCPKPSTKWVREPKTLASTNVSVISFIFLSVCLSILQMKQQVRHICCLFDHDSEVHVRMDRAVQLEGPGLSQI